MEYSFKNLLKMFFTGKPNPYKSPDVPTPLAYKTYVINFPDGVATTDKYFANIPDYTTWTEPMVELFLLIVKDWRNWETTYHNVVKPRCEETQIYTHKPTGIWIKKFSWHLNMRTDEECLRYDNNLLNFFEIKSVVLLAKIWKDVHYGNKLARIERIKTLRSARIKQEEEAKRAELNKQARSAEAKKIREYLEGVGK